jgi:hypothetical protein
MHATRLLTISRSSVVSAKIAITLDQKEAY